MYIAENKYCGPEKIDRRLQNLLFCLHVENLQCGVRDEIFVRNGVSSIFYPEGFTGLCIVKRGFMNEIGYRYAKHP